MKALHGPCPGRLSRLRVRAALTASAIAVGAVALTAPAAQAKLPSYGYDLAGTATLKTLVKGAVPLKGGLQVEIAPGTGELTGALELQTATAKLVALGFLPLTAKIQFAPTGPTTGTFTGGVLRTSSKVRIKLLRLSFGGLDLVGQVGTCQTKQASNVLLQSGPGFDPAAGGRLTGTFSISDLTGCAYAGGLLSSLTAGKNNAVALTLTPAAVPPARPTNLTARPSRTSVSLDWDDNADGIDVFDVFQDGVKVASVNTSGALITGLQPSTTYRFKVAARNPAGVTTDSDVLSVTTTDDLGGATLQTAGTCVVPVIGSQPATFSFETSIPSTVPLGAPTPAFQFRATTSLGSQAVEGLRLLDAVVVRGSGTLSTEIALPGPGTLPVNVPFELRPVAVPESGAAGIDLVGDGRTPTLTFPSAGTAQITVKALTLTIKLARADGTLVQWPGVAVEDPSVDPFAAQVTCTFDPARDPTLVSISVLSVMTAATPAASTR